MIASSGPDRPQEGHRVRTAMPFALALLTLGMTWSALAPAAEDYPSRPIRFIVPFPPGGSNDIMARLMSLHLTERLGKPVIIDNRAGAGSIVGTDIASKAQPDGHTIVIISAAFSFGSALHAKLPYDPVKSFVPISKLATGPNALAVYPGLPVKTVKELIALAKAKPGSLNFAGAGSGSSQHLAWELFRMMTGVDVVHVPFKGGAPAVLDVMAGNSQIALGTIVQLIPHIRSAKIRAIATAGRKRSSALPELPTIDETVPGYEASNWWGVLAPAKTPENIVERLDKEFASILVLEDVRKRFAYDGAEPDYMSQGEFWKFAAAETAKWTKVIKQAGIKPQ